MFCSGGPISRYSPSGVMRGMGCWSCILARAGARRKLNGSDIFSGFGGFSGSYGRVIVWMLLTWAFFGVLFVSGGRVILSSIPDEVILCVG